jgi:hypothetical protein
MTLAEMASRLADLGRHGFIFFSLRRLQSYVPAHPRFSNGSFRISPINFTTKGKCGEESSLERVAADHWLDHRANFFSLNDIPLGEAIDWNCDYSTGVRGPTKYSGLIDHRNSTLVGDVKYVWELNRLQHLVLLALAFSRTGNAKYREEIVGQTISWISSNPFMMGLNWKSPLEAAIRLISWAFVTCLLGNEFPSIFHDKLRATIYQHQYFIWKFYSKHSSANNHLIGEMAGLYVASVIWPLYQESSSWRSMARETLIQETMRQVGPDGVGRELATEYQLFILEFLLVAGALGQAAGDRFPEQFWQRLNCMITFLSAISDRNGNLPMFGDGDSGQVVALPETIQVRTQRLVRLGCGNGEPITGPAGRDARTRLLLWGQSSEHFPLRSGPRWHEGLRAFSDGGYYVLRVGQDRDDAMMIVFDAGPLGLPPLYAHGHADALSFWLSCGGQEFLVDPGTFCYYTNESWRSYFRSTAAHNTIRIDRQDQSIPIGRFQWAKAARCRTDHINDTDEWVEVEACHDGYRRLADPVLHRRRLRLFKESRKLLICDRLDSASSHDIEIFFHFGERCQVAQTEPNSFVAETGNRRLHVKLDSQLAPELVRGSEEPILGWISRAYGVKVPSFTLVGRTRLAGSTQLLTEIAPV